MGSLLLVDLKKLKTAVGGSPTGKCGLLPQHFYHRVNAVVVLLA